MKPNQTFALKWTFFTTTIVAILNLLFYLTKIEVSSSLRYIIPAVFIICIIYASYDYREKVLNGSGTFSQLFLFAIFTSTLTVFSISIFSLFYFQYIDINGINEIIQSARIRMENSGMSDKDIEEAMYQMKANMTPIKMFMWGFLMYEFLALLTSLSTAMVLRKDPPEILTENDIIT